MSKGFTFVEFLIIVAIIGIVAAIAIPSLERASELAEQTKAIQKDFPGAYDIERTYVDGKKLVTFCHGPHRMLLWEDYRIGLVGACVGR